MKKWKPSDFQLLCSSTIFLVECTWWRKFSATIKTSHRRFYLQDNFDDFSFKAHYEQFSARYIPEVFMLAVA